MKVALYINDIYQVFTNTPTGRPTSTPNATEGFSEIAVILIVLFVILFIAAVLIWNYLDMRHRGGAKVSTETEVKVREETPRISPKPSPRVIVPTVDSALQSAPIPKKKKGLGIVGTVLHSEKKRTPDGGASNDRRLSAAESGDSGFLNGAEGRPDVLQVPPVDNYDENSLADF